MTRKYKVRKFICRQVVLMWTLICHLKSNREVFIDREVLNIVRHTRVLAIKS